MPLGTAEVQMVDQHEHALGADAPGVNGVHTRIVRCQRRGCYRPCRRTFRTHPMDRIGGARTAWGVSEAAAVSASLARMCGRSASGRRHSTMQEARRLSLRALRARHPRHEQDVSRRIRAVQPDAGDSKVPKRGKKLTDATHWPARGAIRPDPHHRCPHPHLRSGRRWSPHSGSQVHGRLRRGAVVCLRSAP